MKENAELLFNHIRDSYKSFINELNNRLSPYSITASQFFVLKDLYNNKTLSVQQLIDNNHDSSGNMTVVLRNLEQKQLITRITNSFDLRSYLFSLTDKGLDIIVEIMPIFDKWLMEAFGTHSDSEVSLLINTIF